MDRIPLFGVTTLWVCSSMTACHGPQARSAVDVRSPVAGQGDVANSQAARAAARQVEVLHQLVALDRKSVELAELRVAQLRLLEEAGRVGNVDRMAAEVEWIQQKRLLLLRELELEQAQEAAAADVSAPPASESPVQRATSP